MKNIINPDTKVVKRVSNSEAFQAVNYDGFEYTTKSKLKSFLNRSVKEIKSQKVIVHLELKNQAKVAESLKLKIPYFGLQVHKSKEKDSGKIIGNIVFDSYNGMVLHQRRVLQY